MEGAPFSTVSSIQDVDRLLSAGFDPNQENEHGKTAVFYCESVYASFGVPEFRRLISLLVAYGCDLDHRDRSGATALLLSESDEFSLAMLQAGASVCVSEARLSSTKSCLVSSAKKGHLQSISFMVRDLGVNVDQYLGTGTALHHCVRDHLLLEEGGDVIEGMRALVGHSLCIDAPDFLGKTALSLVSDSVGCATMLLDNGADPNAKIPQGIWFHRQWFDSFVSGDLCSNDMNMLLRGKLWETPIHGVHHRSPEVIQLLLERGAGVDSFDSDGNTALMRLLGDGVGAMSRNILEVFNILFSFDASCTTLNHGGESVRDMPLAQHPQVSGRLQKRARDENWVRRRPFFLVVDRCKSSGNETVIGRLAAGGFVPSEGFMRDIVMFI